MVTETYPPEVNGVALTLARLIQGLIDRGHRVQLVRPRQGKFDGNDETAAFSEFLTAGMPIPGYPGLRFGLPCRRDLRRLWAATRPDIVHVATEGPLGASAVAAARSLGLPVSSGFHTNFDAYSKHYGLGWLRGFVSHHLQRFHNETDLTLVPTPELARHLETRGYRNVATLARGVDTRLFNPAKRSPALRQSWGVDDETLVVAYVGRLAPEKNLPIAIETFDALSMRHSSARLLLVGDGPLSGKLRKCDDSRHILAGVRRGEDLAMHYASANLFLFPSVTETYGNVVPEALASGLAVVAFGCAAAAYLIEDGVNGRIVAANDRLAFLDAAIALADNRKAMAELGARAAASVARLGWENIQERFARQLAELASAPASRHH